MQDEEMWKQALSWHRQRKGTLTLHSKQPHRAPKGFIRLGYHTKGSERTQGPDYLYIKPKWVFSLLPGREDIGEAPHVGFREPERWASLGARIDDESYRRLKKAWNLVREPFQIQML